MDRSPVSHTAHSTAARTGALTRAVVCAGGVETSYLRVGRGPAIVVVADDVDGVEAQRLVADLAPNHLVLVAAPRASSNAALATWKRNFLDGLGIADAHVLLCTSALARMEALG